MVIYEDNLEVNIRPAIVADAIAIIDLHFAAVHQSASSFYSPEVLNSWSPQPVYKHPKKNWRLKRGATPQWYKQRHGIRGKAQSGAARVARFRPPRSQA